MKRHLLLLTAQPLPLSVVLLLALTACQTADSLPRESAERAAAVEALAGNDIEGYTQALETREFSFPADHGPHPDFKTEWWYFTGHLEGSNGRSFGYQLTFFRSALAPQMPERSSSWATRQMYMGHFAVSDLDGGKFHAFERFSRGAAGLAGAGGAPFRVWLEDWSAESIGEDVFPLRLRAQQDDLALDLTLMNEKPPVFHGDRGLSHKGSEPGNASYYYSLTRMAANGRLTLDGEERTVRGSSWLDREWSTSVLDDDQVGWDWFSLQLDDGRDLMVAQLRLEDGSVDPISHGTLVAVDGSTQPLQWGDFRLEVTETWRSPRGPLYPAGWHLTILPKAMAESSESAAIELAIRPLLADQELDISFRYWEGAVEARGSSGGLELSGRGYVELVGYTD